jgi:hypothetical protein
VDRRLFGALLACLTVACTAAHSQSNEFLDLYLDGPAAYGDTAYVALAAARLIDADASVDAAMAALQSRGWGIDGRGPEDQILLGEYAYLLMRAFEIRGGLFYRMFPGPRYATREMTYLGMIQGRAMPDMEVSGERALRILGRVLDRQGGRS